MFPNNWVVVVSVNEGVLCPSMWVVVPHGGGGGVLVHKGCCVVQMVKQVLP